VNEKERAREAEVRKEEAERLRAFREQREKGNDTDQGIAADGTALADDMIWTAGGGKKRKKGKDSKDALRGLKVRRTSSTAAKEDVKAMKRSEEANNKTGEDVTKPAPTSASAQLPSNPSADMPAKTPALTSTAPPPLTLGLGLAGYSSDEE
jgi:hypothetical protein